MQNFLLLTVFCFSLYTVSGQKQLQHQKSKYVDENGRFYINKHLPVYLRMAIEPQKESKSWLLKSQVTKEYSNPMYFPNEGYNIIRSPWCVDPDTRNVVIPRKYVVFEVYADGIAPSTTPRFSNSIKYTDFKKVYYNDDLKINFKTYDKVSKTKATYYSLNGADFESTKEPVEFISRNEIQYKLKYYSVDNVGNVEDVEETEFIIDREPPETRYILRGVAEGENVLSWDSYILLKSKDKLSGVKQIYYAMDGGSPVVYKDKITFENLDGGEHYIDFYAVDNVGNSDQKDKSDSLDASTINYFKFIVDKKGPEVSLRIEGDQYQGKYLYISERTKFTVKSADKESGTAIIYYGIDRAAKSKKFDRPFSVTSRKGIHRINYTAMDNVKNMAPAKYEVVYLDNEPPATSIDYKYPQFFDRDTLFISDKTPIALYPRDGESGIKTLEYSIDGESYQEYDNPFTIQNGGYHTITFKATDNVNNQEQKKESEIVVDNTSPVIYANFNIKPIREEEYEGEKYPVYPTYTRIYIGATDRFSGTENIYYSINGSPMRKYATAKSISDANLLTEENFYIVKIAAEDKLGNRSEKDIKFLIRKK